MHMCDAHSLAEGHPIACKLLVTQLLKKNFPTRHKHVRGHCVKWYNCSVREQCSGKLPHPQWCPWVDCIAMTSKMWTQQVSDESWNQTKQAPDLSTAHNIEMHLLTSHFITSSSLTLVLEDKHKIKERVKRYGHWFLSQH